MAGDRRRWVGGFRVQTDGALFLVSGDRKPLELKSSTAALDDSGGRRTQRREKADRRNRSAALHIRCTRLRSSRCARFTADVVPINDGSSGMATNAVPRASQNVWRHSDRHSPLLFRHDVASIGRAHLVRDRRIVLRRGTAAGD
nr:unnamed protein product [Digitaria exilis]